MIRRAEDSRRYLGYWQCCSHTKALLVLRQSN